MHLPMSLILDVSSKFNVVVVVQLTEQVRVTQLSLEIYSAYLLFEVMMFNALQQSIQFISLHFFLIS